MPSFLRQLSGREALKSTSNRFSGTIRTNYGGSGNTVGWEAQAQVEGLNIYEGDNNAAGMVLKKRVMVVVDQSSHSKHAMMWALTHVANKGDILTLLHVVPASSPKGSDPSSSTCVATSLGSLCRACKQEVEVEALVVQGPKLATVISQVKKLEVSVLVVGQKQPSPFINCVCGMMSCGADDEFVEQCINGAECLTIGVRKQRRGVGGYLVSTRWQKNFWLLA